MNDLTASLSADQPPEMSAPKQALWWLAKGDFKVGRAWEMAHDICQQAEGTRDYDLVHAVAHLIEGDVGNADYWYRRAGVKRGSDDPQAEWHTVASMLG